MKVLIYLTMGLFIFLGLNAMYSIVFLSRPSTSDEIKEVVSLGACEKKMIQEHNKSQRIINKGMLQFIQERCPILDAQKINSL